MHAQAQHWFVTGADAGERDGAAWAGCERPHRRSKRRRASSPAAWISQVPRTAGAARNNEGAPAPGCFVVVQPVLENLPCRAVASTWPHRPDGRREGL